MEQGRSRLRTIYASRAREEDVLPRGRWLAEEEEEEQKAGAIGGRVKPPPPIRWVVVRYRKPPEAATVSPVIHPESADARNTAIGAMSSGWPNRPSGVTAIICFSRSLRIMPMR